MKKIFSNDYFLFSILYVLLAYVTVLQSTVQDFTSIIDFDLTVIHNSLQLVSQSTEPEIKKILKILKSFKKIIAFGMSGSGSSCFGIFKNNQDFINEKEFETLKLQKNYFIWHGNKKEFGYNRIIY